MKKAASLLCAAALILSVSSMGAAAGEAAMPGARSTFNEDSGDVFLGGNYIEMGLSKSGSFGSYADAPAGFHAVETIRRPESNLCKRLGFLVDKDGFDVGEAPVTGDFFLPGSPEERYVLGYKLGDGEFNNIGADRMGAAWLDAKQAPATTDTSDKAKGLLSATTVGITKEGVKFTQVISFGVNDTFMKIHVTVENTTEDKTFTDVRYVRSVDPDIDYDMNAEDSDFDPYSTLNKVISNPAPAYTDDMAAMIMSIGPKTFQPMVYLSFDKHARGFATDVDGALYAPKSVYETDLWNESTEGLATKPTPDAYTVESPSIENYTAKGFMHVDNAIQMTTRLGDLAPGKSADTAMYISLEPDVSKIVGDITEAEKPSKPSLDIKNSQVTGSGSAAIKNTPAELLNAVMSAGEQAKYTSKDKIFIQLVIKDSGVSEADKTAAAAALPTGKAVGAYYDLSLLLSVNSEESAVTKTNSAIRITLDIPSTIKGSHFQILRVHEGKGTLLDDLDTDDATVTFETDEFSTYALVYTPDVPAPAPNPPTGYETGAAAFLLAAAAGAVLLTRRDRSGK